jgi:hypothetical protein
MLLTLTLLFSCNVYGEDEQLPNDMVEKYTNMSTITSALSISTSGTAICTGSYVMTKSLDSELILTLQRRPKSGTSAFTTYKQWSASHSGKGTFSMEKTPTVTKGYDYRLQVVVKVYSGTTVTEAGACYSGIVTY